jgi:hypothetical protein
MNCSRSGCSFDVDKSPTAEATDTVRVALQEQQMVGTCVDQRKVTAVNQAIVRILVMLDLLCAFSAWRFPFENRVNFIQPVVLFHSQCILVFVFTPLQMMGWTTTAFLVLAAEASGLLIVPQAGAKSEEEKRKEESNRQLDNAARDRANPQDERNRNRPSESSDVTVGFKWDLDSRGRLSNGRACVGRGSNMTCTDDVRRELRPGGDK